MTYVAATFKYSKFTVAHKGHDFRRKLLMFHRKLHMIRGKLAMFRGKLPMFRAISRLSIQNYESSAEKNACSVES